MAPEMPPRSSKIVPERNFGTPWSSKVIPWVPKLVPGVPKVPPPQPAPGLKREPFWVPKATPGARWAVIFAYVL